MIGSRLCRALVLLLAVAVFGGLLLPVSAAVALPMPANLIENPVNMTKPVMRSTVAIHYSPNPYSMVIGQLEDHAPLNVLGTSGAYYRIDCYEMDGYIHESLVEETDAGYRVKHRFDSPDSGYLTDRSVGEGILLRNSLFNSAMAVEGVPYVLGGTTPRGFDCSGFTQYVYKQNGISIPRTCEAQIGAGLIIPKDELQCGDIILFTRTNHPTALVTHVGMYLGDGKLIHAGSGGITVVRLESRYFTEHYLCARRIVPTRETELMPLHCATAAEGATITPRSRRIP